MKINSIYTEEQINKDMRNYFEEEASISLISFFEEELTPIREKLLKSRWDKIENPIKGKKYVLNPNNYDIEILRFIEFFNSKELTELMEKISGFSLRNLKTEICKYNHSCFSVYEHDYKDTETIELIFDLTLTWHKTYGGALVYGSKSQDLLFITPTYNNLTILFKPEGVSKYLKYINNLAKENSILRVEISYEIIEEDIIGTD